MDIIRYKVIIERNSIRHTFDYGENRARAKKQLGIYETCGWDGYIYTYTWKENEDQPRHSFTFWKEGKRYKTKEIDMTAPETRAAKLDFIAHHMNEYYKRLKGEERDQEEEYTDPEYWIDSVMCEEFLFWYLDPKFMRRNIDRA